MTSVVGSGGAVGASDRDGSGDADGGGDTPPTELSSDAKGRPTKPPTTNAIITSAVTAASVNRSSRGNHRGAQTDRRDWWVVRTSTAMARLVDSGSSFGPSSSQAATIALLSRGAFMRV